jgi:hypothetical protein
VRVLSEETEREAVKARFERWGHLPRDERINELHAFPEEQVIEKHDALVDEAAASSKPPVSSKLLLLERAQFYANELARRETVRQGERMETLTRSINRLTWVITLATIAGVGLTVLAYFSG